MSRSGVLCVPLLIAAMTCAYAQQQEGVTQTSSSPQAQPPVQPPPPPAQPKAPYTIEDGGISVEPFYWFTTILPATPNMKGGVQSGFSNANLDYPGIIKNAPGIIISIPAGPQNTVRISYFRVQGRGTETLGSNLTLLGTAYSSGDFLSTTYVLNDLKASWDFLTYRIPAGQNKIRFKTLWEVQWLEFSTNLAAPYAPVMTDSSGNVITNYASESHNILLPTLGAELEQAPFRHVRYEVKASGFTIPHHADIWEAEASLAFRFGKVEFLAGAKAFHFKTSPQADEYFSEMLSGPYAGIRYYLSRQPE